MKSYKTICHLQDIKIKLLEEFILESARLVDLYEWVADPEQMIKLDSLSTQLDDITKKINNLTNASLV
jgi:hypothetical protein